MLAYKKATCPVPASSHQPDNSIFLSHHSNSSLLLQPAEHGGCRGWMNGSTWHIQKLAKLSATAVLHQTSRRPRNFAAMLHEHEAPRLFVIRGHAALVTQSRKAAERHFEHWNNASNSPYPYIMESFLQEFTNNWAPVLFFLRKMH